YSFALLITSIIFFPDNFIMPNGIQLIFAMSLGVMGSLGHLFMSQAAKYADVAMILPLSARKNIDSHTGKLKLKYLYVISFILKQNMDNNMKEIPKRLLFFDFINLLNILR
ncbi:hypothetical protein N9U85_00880, partial [bacterium]|nr:hypothetical protein [bacterium]